MIDALTLFERLRKIVALHSNADGSTYVKDILIRQDEPIRLETPRGLINADPNSVAFSTEAHAAGLEDVDAFERWTAEDIVKFFKRLDPNWEEKLKHGAVDRPVAIGNNRLRANLFTYNGEFASDGSRPGKIALAIRVFPREIPDLGDLGLPVRAGEMINSRSGLIMLTGGTGAGKSTTAASMFKHVNQTRAGHLITIENPIELEHQNIKCVVSQREVGPNVGAMARGVVDAMRQFPLGILIGEVRDSEAAEAALYAGESGHLVLGTQHSNSAVGSISKLVEIFPGSQETHAGAIAQCLLGVIAQTLVPSRDQTRWVPIFETIVLSEKTRELVARRNWNELQNRLRKGEDESLVSLNCSFIRAIKQGKITEETASRYAYDREHLTSLLKALDKHH